MKKSSARKRRSATTRRNEFYRLRLYIAGQTPNSVAAIANLEKICEDKLRGKYRIEVVDLLKKPQPAIAVEHSAITGEKDQGNRLREITARTIDEVGRLARGIFWGRVPCRPVHSHGHCDYDGTHYRARH